jgi:hypothetical protein
MGSQVSIIALLIINLTFPVFSQGSQATYMLGFLVAYCALPTLSRRAAGSGRGSGIAPVPVPS